MGRARCFIAAATIQCWIVVQLAIWNPGMKENND
jgi:hypothetical protein